MAFEVSLNSAVQGKQSMSALRICSFVSSVALAVPRRHAQPWRHSALRKSSDAVVVRCSSNSSSASLYLVSTPIGNPADLSPRARAILQSVHTIAAEDTRVTKALLDRSSSAFVVSCNSHNINARLPNLLKLLSSGHAVALVSDAGTPCISDPGAPLVAAAVKAGIRVVPIPGPCAVSAALSASGIAASRYLFVGFLPRKGKDLEKALNNVLLSEVPVVFFEAPHRIRNTLRRLAEMESQLEPDPESHAKSLNRKVVLARELTKKYEELLRFSSLHEASLFYDETRAPRGEYTVVIEPRQLSTASEMLSNCSVEIRTLIEQLMDEQLPNTTIARILSRSSPLSKNCIYELAVTIKKTRYASPATSTVTVDSR